MKGQERASFVALALGPCRTRGELVQTQDPIKAVKKWFNRKKLFVFWSTCSSASALVDRARRLEQRQGEQGTRLVLACDPDYPSTLARWHRAPPLLFVRGTLPTRPMVGMVGSRAATLVAVERTRRWAGRLCGHGYGVVSGGAIGIDTAAHRGALDCGGQTVAVLGSGLDRPYPERNRRLFAQIPSSGAVVSFFPPGTPPRRGNFPRRNPLIAAWSDAVVVLGANRRSGALQTANWAKKIGIPLFATGDCPGGRQLLAGGASAVGSCDALLVGLSGGPLPPGRTLPQGGDRQQALAHLGSAPLGPDGLARELGWSAARAAAALMRLEMDGFADAVAGGRFVAQNVK